MLEAREASTTYSVDTKDYRFRSGINIEKLVGIVQSWLSQPAVQVVTPGIRHLDLAKELFLLTGGSGRLTTDVHLTALAIEHGATLCSNDKEFLRFRDLDTTNPLE